MAEDTRNPKGEQVLPDGKYLIQNVDSREFLMALVDRRTKVQTPLNSNSYLAPTSGVQEYAVFTSQWQTKKLNNGEYSFTHVKSEKVLVTDQEEKDVVACYKGFESFHITKLQKGTITLSVYLLLRLRLSTGVLQTEVCPWLTSKVIFRMRRTIGTSSPTRTGKVC
ncbi:hypothetical protein BD410DRAFT_831098 [Rickenella mellea]|uniref:Uncharacterized protein n=1 Tax=Rickenella mellea TaxID=50990 RepID=A0A4Y7PSH2_9AGAM|nr:hypothetical protein BD410DRAFT_831098 [Rickenella mellea]